MTQQNARVYPPAPGTKVARGQCFLCHATIALHESWPPEQVLAWNRFVWRHEECLPASAFTDEERTWLRQVLAAVFR